MTAGVPDFPANRQPPGKNRLAVPRQAKSRAGSLPDSINMQNFLPEVDKIEMLVPLKTI
jgi:hypothetical protein